MRVCNVSEIAILDRLAEEVDAAEAARFEAVQAHWDKVNPPTPPTPPPPEHWLVRFLVDHPRTWLRIEYAQFPGKGNEREKLLSLAEWLTYTMGIEVYTLTLPGDEETAFCIR